MSEQIRQLAVIMFTDIAGYTAMMGEDESKAFSLLKINRNVHKKWIARYNGKWLKEMGDGVLASFTSVSDAIYCAGAIQKEAAGIPDLNLRMGIHMGEVIVEVGDVFGDGVNIASRIEAQANAGSIFVSDTVYHNLTNKKGVEAKFVREEQLKNVKHPVRIYEVKVDLPDEVPVVLVERESRSQKINHKVRSGWQRPLTLGLAAILLVAIAYLAFSYFGQPVKSSSANDASRTIIVLPFDNLGSPDDEYFANGITDEITSRLGLIKGFSIISPLSASLFKESGKSIEELADELDVDFVLDGSIRWDKGSESQRVRITPRLTDVSNNRQMWTNNFDRNIEQIFEVQTEIAERVAEALDVNILRSEKQSIQVKLTDNIEAYALYLQGLDVANNINKNNLRQAEEYFEAAIALDPNFAAAYARLGSNHANYWWFYFDRDSSRLIKAKANIDKANELNPDLFDVMLSSGMIHYHAFREYDEALEHLFAAREMKPNNGEVISSISWVKRRQGKYQESIEYMLKAFELDPLSSNVTDNLGETYGLLRDYEKSIYYYDKGILLSPEWHVSYVEKANVIFLSNGDIRQSINLLQSTQEIIDSPDLFNFELAYFYYLNNEFDTALNILDKIEVDELTEQFRFYSKYQLKADINLAMGEIDLSNIYYDSARIYLEEKLIKNPGEPKYHSTLGMVYARLRMNAKAIEQGLLGCELMPESLDAWIGYERILDLARIYSINGDVELALEKIDYLLSKPGNFSKELLKADPVFNAIRGSDGYQEILNKAY